MKKIILFSAILAVIAVGCTKQSVSNKQNETLPAYVGTYDSPKGDTAYVSLNGGYAKIQIAPYLYPGMIHRCFVFDSIVVHPDFSFSDNEICVFGGGWWNYHSLGTGNFTNSTITLNFKLDGGDFSFSGIKRQ